MVHMNRRSESAKNKGICKISKQIELYIYINYDQRYEVIPPNILGKTPGEKKNGRLLKTFSTLCHGMLITLFSVIQVYHVRRELQPASRTSGFDRFSTG